MSSILVLEAKPRILTEIILISDISIYHGHPTQAWQHAKQNMGGWGRGDKKHNGDHHLRTQK